MGGNSLKNSFTETVLAFENHYHLDSKYEALPEKENYSRPSVKDYFKFDENDFQLSICKIIVF